MSRDKTAFPWFSTRRHRFNALTSAGRKGWRGESNSFLVNVTVLSASEKDISFRYSCGKMKNIDEKEFENKIKQFRVSGQGRDRLK